MFFIPLFLQPIPHHNFFLFIPLPILPVTLVALRPSTVINLRHADRMAETKTPQFDQTSLADSFATFMEHMRQCQENPSLQLAQVQLVVHKGFAELGAALANLTNETTAVKTSLAENNMERTEFRRQLEANNKAIADLKLDLISLVVPHQMLIATGSNLSLK
jgi:hypothetical protein